MEPTLRHAEPSDVVIPVESGVLEGMLVVPKDARGLVLFAHGSGSSRLSPRHQAVARYLQERRLGTLLFDLLTRDEGRRDERTAELRFDIGLLARRLTAATAWLADRRDARGLRVGYFGASTGAAAALTAAANRPVLVHAVVSRGGRPDLAREALGRVRAPTLLLVGSDDVEVLRLNQWALQRLRCEKRLEVIGGVGHLFEEPGTLEAAASAAASWFSTHLGFEVH